jgi:hypothetical protein
MPGAALPMDKPAAALGTHVPAGELVALAFVYFACVAIAVVARLGFAVSRSVGTSRRVDELEAASFALYVFGVLGFFGHTVFVPIAEGERWQPNFDVAGFGWALAIGVSFLVPITDKFSAGGVSVELKSKAEKVTGGAFELLRSWSEQTVRYVQIKGRYALPQDAAAWLSVVRSDYVAERIYEAMEWIGADGERRRLCIWALIVANDDPAGTSPRIAAPFYAARFTEAPQPFEYRDVSGRWLPSGGLIGYALRNRESVNAGKASDHPSFAPRRGSNAFGGVYVAPILRRFDGAAGVVRPVGVLTIDREKSVPFDDEQVALFEALTANLGLLMDPDP